MDKEKYLDILFKAYEKYSNTIMVEVFLEKILRSWLEEIGKSHRSRMVTLDALIGKSVISLCCIKPDMELYRYKKEVAELGVKTDKEVEFFVFDRKGICTDAFRVPDPLVMETLPDELVGCFKTFFSVSKEFGIDQKYTDRGTGVLKKKMGFS